jgi:hypothetical protein
MENVVLYVGFGDVFFGEKSSETLSSDRVNSAIKCIATRSFKTGNLFFFFTRKWKEEKATLLEEMDEKERQDQEEWIAQGKKELEEWYARLNEQLGKTKENNR